MIDLPAVAFAWWQSPVVAMLIGWVSGAAILLAWLKWQERRWR